MDRTRLLDRFPFYFHPDPPSGGLLPNPNPDPTPMLTPSPTSHHDVAHPPSVTCDGCGSSVTTMRGEVLKLGARAKAMIQAEDTIERLTRELATARDEITTLRGRLAPAVDHPADNRWQL